ncbi:uncharacterized protein BCR38DRAFT_335658, partial [Pseudomassariella vexata]
MARRPALVTCLAVFFLGRVNGQDLMGEPTCATPCVKTAVPAGGCTIGDIGCMCGPAFVSIFAILGPCLVLQCEPRDINSMSTIASAQCESATLGLFTTTTPTGTVGKQDVTSTSASSTQEHTSNVTLSAP